MEGLNVLSLAAQYYCCYVYVWQALSDICFDSAPWSHPYSKHMLLHSIHDNCRRRADIVCGATKSCGAIFLHMIQFSCHVYQNCSTWQEILHYMWSNLPCTAMSPNHKFTMFVALSWLTLLWRKVHFVRIYELLCGEKSTQMKTLVCGAKMTSIMYAFPNPHLWSSPSPSCRMSYSAG